MADREKVVEHLYDCLAASRLENMWVFVRTDIVGDAISMLKDQEPKPVADIADSVDGIEVGRCPSCDRAIVNKKSDPTRYCKFCGQEVKW